MGLRVGHRLQCVYHLHVTRAPDHPPPPLRICILRLEWLVNKGTTTLLGLLD